MAPSDPPVALVMAGGGSLGAIQVGMLRALVETGLRPAFVIGSSVLGGDGGLVADSMPRGYKARTEQLILVHRLCLGLDLPPTYSHSGSRLQMSLQLSRRAMRGLPRLKSRSRNPKRVAETWRRTAWKSGCSGRWQNKADRPKYT